MAGLGDIIGNEPVKDYFSTAIADGQVSHAYLLAGEAGLGRKTLARAVAMTLQCESEGERPCGVCTSCRMIQAGTHPDVRFVTHEKPGTISVDDVRRQIVSDAAIRPYKGPWKIYIMDEAEKMNPQAQNALLKTIEEPPSYVILFLITSSAEAMLETIASRCIRLSLRPLADSVIREKLAERGTSGEDADVAAAFARGNLGRALALAASEKFEQMRAILLGLLKDVDKRSVSSLVEEIRAVREGGFEIPACLEFISLYYRDVLMFKATKDANLLIFRDEISYVRRRADRMSFEGLESVLLAIDTARERLRANVNFDLTMELLFLSMKEHGR